jgi:hypothetical protein
MQIGVPAESLAGETRVAVTPETAKKLVAQGHRVLVQSGAGLASNATDAAYQAVGAEIVEAATALGAELVLKVRAPSDAELAQMKAGATLVGMLNPFDAEGLQRMAAARPHQLRAGGRAAHHARPEPGRAVLAGQHRRLQGRDAGGQPVPASFPDADDRGRHHQGRARGDPGRRRRRPAGDRHRQAPGRRDRGLRRASLGQGTGRVARRQVHRRAVRDRRGEGDRPKAWAAMRARCRRAGWSARRSRWPSAWRRPTSSSPPR